MNEEFDKNVSPQTDWTIPAWEAVFEFREMFTSLSSFLFGAPVANLTAPPFSPWLTVNTRNQLTYKLKGGRTHVKH